MLELVNRVYDGYNLVTIVTPNNYPYASTEGYIYWFEDIWTKYTNNDDNLID